MPPGVGNVMCIIVIHYAFSLWQAMWLSVFVWTQTQTDTHTLTQTHACAAPCRYAFIQLPYLQVQVLEFAARECGDCVLLCVREKLYEMIENNKRWDQPWAEHTDKQAPQCSYSRPLAHSTSRWRIQLQLAIIKRKWLCQIATKAF